MTKIVGLIFRPNFAKKNSSGQKQKKITAPLNFVNSSESVSTKFQYKLKIDFLEQVCPKGVYWV